MKIRKENRYKEEVISDASAMLNQIKIKQNMLVSSFRSEVYMLFHMANYYSLPLSLEKISKHFVSTKEVDFFELENTADKLNFRTFIVVYIDWKELIKIPKPAILFRENGSPHFFIIEKVSWWYALLLNPQTGERVRFFRWQLSIRETYYALLLHPKKEY